MKTYLKYLSILGLVVSLALFGTACSSGSSSDADDDDGDDAADATTGGADTASVISSTRVSGDYNVSISPSVDSDGSLTWTVPGVDVNGNGTVGVASVSGTSAAAGSCTDTDTCSSLVKGGVRATTSDVTCAEREVGSGDSADAFDIAISLDTTGSMGGASGALASKIADFATALEEAGVDAKFAGITVGDAYATKSSSSSFTDDVSTGSLGEPPDFDSTERPDTGADLISADDMATFFDEVALVVDTGLGGAGLPENYLGPIQFGNDELTWRDGAARVMITVGDDCAYTPDSYTADGIEGVWIPPDPDDLEDDLSTSGTVVHVIGNDLDCESYYGDGYYDPADLADATGGTFTDISDSDCSSADTCDIDLTELPITDSITSGTVNDCATTCDLFAELGFEDVTIEITITFFLSIDMVDDGETFESVWAVVMSMTLDC